MGGNVMSVFDKAEKNLKANGFAVKVFSTGAEAAAYLDKELDGVSIGIGGSATVRDLGLYELLEKHNQVYWHWKQEPDEARSKAMTADVYLCSANALAETGEIVNMDGNCNRVASTLFGHKKVVFLIGRNKLAPDYEQAVWRTRNVASPKRAQQMGAKTPCAVKADRCYNCKSPGRVCRGLVTLLGPSMAMDYEILLIDEDLGL